MSQSFETTAPTTNHSHQQNNPGNSVLTPFERQELAKYQHRGLRPSNASPHPPKDDIERRTKHLFGGVSSGGGGGDDHQPQHNKGRRHTLANTNKSVLSMLRRVLLKKMAKGEEIKVNF